MKPSTWIIPLHRGQLNLPDVSELQCLLFARSKMQSSWKPCEQNKHTISSFTMKSSKQMEQLVFMTVWLLHTESVDFNKWNTLSCEFSYLTRLAFFRNNPLHDGSTFQFSLNIPKQQLLSSSLSFDNKGESSSAVKWFSFLVFRIMIPDDKGCILRKDSLIIRYSKIKMNRATKTMTKYRTLTKSEDIVLQVFECNCRFDSLNPYYL